MANSIIGPGSVVSNGNVGFNPQMLKQLSEFKRNYKGDPKKAVMQMLQNGQITNPQLQQAMQMARQIQTMLK